jgi:hypothetical protein
VSGADEQIRACAEPHVFDDFHAIIAAVIDDPLRVVLEGASTAARRVGRREVAAAQTPQVVCHVISFADKSDR